MELSPLIIIGSGFLGEAVLTTAITHGHQVVATTHHSDSAERLKLSLQQNLPEASLLKATFLSADVTSPLSLQQLGTTIEKRFANRANLLFCVSSRGGGIEAYRTLYKEGLIKTLAYVPHQKALFVSSTSVYGQQDGEIVTEESQTLPSKETSQILLEAENVALEKGNMVARLAGLYGPGRSFLLKKFLAGQATIEGKAERWINQIHRDDAAAALYHLLYLVEEEKRSGIYNVADDTPAMQKHLYQWLSDYFQKPLPPISLEALPRKRGNSSKRVANTKLKSLGWNPKFRSYQEALPSLLTDSFV